MQNLNRAEIRELQRRCEKQRRLARTSPCFHAGQALAPEYGFCYGPWNLRLTYDRFVSPPTWHGTISVFKEIGTEPVVDEQGRRLFEAPQDALLAVASWTQEEQDAASDLLGILFGELLSNKDQQVLVSDGIFARHWLTRALDS